MQRNTIILLILILINTNPLWSQSSDEVIAIITTLEKESSRKKPQEQHKEEVFLNEYQMVLSASFRFYKRFISSQDASQCSFIPSCSEYAARAIEQQGVIPGILNFFDRFSRCNSLSPENYKRDPHYHLLIDPVRNIRYEKTQ
ncbi:MAG: hypothetical protein CSA95_07760 [Bacteroidetes bacterium]|nr:MAG: hypothetical protein CSA95_07760 [Bacteroidota bacterium]PIE88715.1 MAG: hypothetical protein CSA04_00455 [Bacteroidota bacterium]